MLQSVLLSGLVLWVALMDFFEISDSEKNDVDSSQMRSMKEKAESGESQRKVRG